MGNALFCVRSPPAVKSTLLEPLDNKTVVEDFGSKAMELLSAALGAFTQGWGQSFAVSCPLTATPGAEHYHPDVVGKKREALERSLLKDLKVGEESGSRVSLTRSCLS